MTNQQHPITPPPELIRKWNEEAATAPMADQRYIATQAARWGDGQRLEACCEWLRDANHHGLGDEVAVMLAGRLRAAMRPKPPSLVEEALNALVHLCDGASNSMDTVEAAEYIQRALERLQQLEDSND